MFNGWAGYKFLQSGEKRVCYLGYGFTHRNAFWGTGTRLSCIILDKHGFDFVLKLSFYEQLNIAMLNSTEDLNNLVHLLNNGKRKTNVSKPNYIYISHFAT